MVDRRSSFYHSTYFPFFFLFFSFFDFPHGNGKWRYGNQPVGTRLVILVRGQAGWARERLFVTVCKSALEEIYYYLKAGRASSRKRYGTMPMTSKFLFFRGRGGGGETRVVNNTTKHTADFHDSKDPSFERYSRKSSFPTSLPRSISRGKEFFPFHRIEFQTMMGDHVFQLCLARRKEVILDSTKDTVSTGRI